MFEPVKELSRRVKLNKPDARLGRGQVVRHRFLVAVFAGSNPAAPATFSGINNASIPGFFCSLITALSS